MLNNHFYLNFLLLLLLSLIGLIKSGLWIICFLFIRRAGAQKEEKLLKDKLRSIKVSVTTLKGKEDLRKVKRIIREIDDSLLNFFLTLL